jgi:transposase-like protein
MVDEGKQLARELREARARRAPGGFGEELRARVARYYLESWRQGIPAKRVAAELGLAKSQLDTWLRQLRASGFQEVEVLDDGRQQAQPKATTTALPAGDAGMAAGEDLQETQPLRGANALGMTLVSPKGWRVEGVELATLLVLLEKLS